MDLLGTADLIALSEEISLDNVNIGVIEKFMSELPDKALRFGIRVLLAIFVFLIGVQLIKIIRKILKKTLKKANADVGVIQFLDSLIKAVLYVLLVFAIASGFGLDAASVIALLGSAGVAIGLAIQGSLSNFAGGVLILLLKPFKVGDYIREDSKGNEGTVSEIQLFYTKLITVDNKVIILPNGTLANSSLTNITASEVRMLNEKVTIAYDSDLDFAKKVLKNVLMDEEAVLKDKDVLVFVDSLGDSAIVMGIRCWMKQENYWKGKWRILENVKKALDGAQITIPFPQMDVHVHHEE